VWQALDEQYRHLSDAGRCINSQVNALDRSGSSINSLLLLLLLLLFYCCGVVLRLIYLDTDSPQATSESAAAATRSSLARELQQLEAQIADNHREVTHPPTPPSA
jgi:cell division protein FtsB